jgi:hypothetical protein
MNMDWEFTNKILKALNEGTLVSPPVQWAEFPSLGQNILDRRSPGALVVSRPQLESVLERFLPRSDRNRWLSGAGDWVTVTSAQMEELGLAIVPFTAFGVLNGGMATSYADTKKNRGFVPALFERLQAPLEAAAKNFGHLPKGITPAFFQPDGTAGPTYLELKLRHLLMLNGAARRQGHQGPGMKLFQMTSDSTDGAIRNAWATLKASPTLCDLLDLTPDDLAESPTAVQDLVGTFTPRDTKLPRRLFTLERDGKQVPYALPAGHGQNFRVLGPIYRQLEREGYRYVYLGNIDNLGYLPSLASLATLALRGAPAGFDFSFKTPLDTKGGVLYRQPDGRLNCADLGVAIDAKQVNSAEAAGTPILFNCATGLFDLAQLNANLPVIIEKLPVRVSEQDKDAGRYAQAEQVTWEVIGLLDEPLIFGVEKQRRFLAAKLMLDCFLTSGLILDDIVAPDSALAALQTVSRSLNNGLVALLSGPLAMKLVEHRWVPLSRNEIDQRLEQWRFLSV